MISFPVIGTRKLFGPELAGLGLLLYWALTSIEFKNWVHFIPYGQGFADGNSNYDVFYVNCCNAQT